MNSTTIRKVGLLLFAVACLAAPRASAIVLDFDVTGLGYYTPASQANNNTDATAAVNAVINWYNGGTNPNGGTITYTLDPGSGVPAPDLPIPAVFGFKADPPPLPDVSPSEYSYLLGKYGNTAYIFYIGNLAPGSYTLPNILGGNELSHGLAFTSQTTSVPDGGAPMALLGCTLLFVEFARRRFLRV